MVSSSLNPLVSITEGNKVFYTSQSYLRALDLKRINSDLERNRDSNSFANKFIKTLETYGYTISVFCYKDRYFGESTRRWLLFVSNGISRTAVTLCCERPPKGRNIFSIEIDGCECNPFYGINAYGEGIEHLYLEMLLSYLRQTCVPPRSEI